MSNRPRALVIQQGGSSTEFYATAYNSHKEAARAVKGHEEASYNAFEVEIPPALAKALGADALAEAEFIAIAQVIARKVAGG